MSSEKSRYFTIVDRIFSLKKWEQDIIPKLYNYNHFLLVEGINTEEKGEKIWVAYIHFKNEIFKSSLEKVMSGRKVKVTNATYKQIYDQWIVEWKLTIKIEKKIESRQGERTDLDEIKRLIIAREITTEKQLIDKIPITMFMKYYKAWQHLLDL